MDRSRNQVDCVLPANTAPQATDGVCAAGRMVEDTQRWLRQAVIGLNLCPFAKAVDVKGQVHYAVSRGSSFSDLLADFKQELLDLEALESAVRDTTLFIAPAGLTDFLVFNDFVAKANRLLAKIGFSGVFQIASLHPHYVFGDEEPDALANFTNRAPYPTLHILRETSVDRAVHAFPDASTIFETNRQTMERLGLVGWEALDVGCHAQTIAPAP